MSLRFPNVFAKVDFDLEKQTKKTKRREKSGVQLNIRKKSKIFTIQLLFPLILKTIWR